MCSYIDPAFARALAKTVEDHDRYGEMSSGDWEENGAMRVVGIARGDCMRLLHAMLEEYRGELSEGGAPQAEALLVIIEIALSAGVNLERERQEVAAGLVDPPEETG